MALVLAAITVLGLALRIWSARGGLWVDEAWSAVMVERARTPLGIFTAINHDNNHHLNSLWMLLCGYGAAPMALRALSIASGTASIIVAAAIGARRGATEALVTALVFAVSPMMVNYGSEARGYMPMLLALMTTIWLIARWLETPTVYSMPRGRLGALAILGLFAQLTMVFGLAALGVWVMVTLARTHSTDRAIPLTIRLFLPSAVAAFSVFAVVLGAAAASPTGMQVGDYVAFSAPKLWDALRIMVAATLGGLVVPPAAITVVLIAIVAALAFAVRTRDPKAVLYLAAILGLPLVLTLLRVGNTGIPRYFLLSSIALLLMLASLVAKGLASRRPIKIVALAVLAAVTFGSVRDDLVQAALRRGDTGAAISGMAAIAPRGASVLVDHLRPIATLRVAAAEARYPLRIVSDCPAAMFVHRDLVDDAPAAQTIERCGARYQRIVVRRRAALSGVDWALYARRPA
ncbi:hypothetical protein [Sphingomonas sp. M1A8_2b]